MITDRAAPSRRFVRIGVMIILAVLALVTIAVPTAWVLMGRAPSWWRPPPARAESLARGAEAVERAFSAELARNHEVEKPWSIDITEDAANAWLNHRLPLWLDHEGIELPWPVDSISARFDSAAIRIGVERSADRSPRIVGITVVPRVDPQTGAVRATVSSLHLGGLAVPGWLARRAGALFLDTDAGDQTGRILSGSRAFEVHPIHLQDGRSVELIGITLQAGRIRLTFRAIADSGSAAPDGLP